MKKYQFHDISRSERYFTATHLSHLLMSNNFEGTKLLFRKFLNDKKVDQGRDFEIVTELDPLRDASVLNNVNHELYKKHGRVAVPDIFLRWGKHIIVIEAKFFTLPTRVDLEFQINEQRRAINLILDNTQYDSNFINYVLLLIEKPKLPMSNSLSYLTWDELIKMFKGKSSSFTIDCQYSLDILEKSVIRAKKELQKKSKINFRLFKTIQELIDSLPTLLNEGKIYVGFSEGLYSNEYDLKHFEQRGHYKVSDEKHTKNWVRIEELISKYINLKYEM